MWAPQIALVFQLQSFLICVIHRLILQIDHMPLKFLHRHILIANANIAVVIAQVARKRRSCRKAL